MLPGACVVDNYAEQLFTLTLYNVLPTHRQVDRLARLDQVDPSVLFRMIQKTW